MTRHVRLSELLVGIEGLALLRHLYDGTDEAADRRIEEVRRILEGQEFMQREAIHEEALQAGYQAWSDSYDEADNPIVALEQPAVWSLIADLPAGHALDAACGTGRHAAHLVELGHDVLGIDLSAEMLARAAAAVPQARFFEADLRSIPAADQQFDVVVCGLALSHLADLRGGAASLARVLRPGGHLVISVLHPFQAWLGWHAPFRDGNGDRRFVREHAHSHADYLSAFSAARLELRACMEPRLGAEHVRAKRRASRHIPEAATQAYVGLPAVLVWSAGKA